MIDPTIPLSAIGRQAPPVSPFEVAQSLGSMRVQAENARALAAERDAITEQKRQQIAAAQKTQVESQQLETLFGSGQPVRPEQVYGIVGPDRGAKILQGLSALQETNLKTETARRTLIGSVVGGLKALPEPMRPDAYTSVRQHLVGNGIFKPEDIPEQYNPAYLDAAQQWALTPKEQLENTRAEQKQAAELPGTIAKSTQEARSVAAGLLAQATSKEDYAAKLASIPDPALRGAFPPPQAWSAKSTPGTVRAIGMTPEQQRTAETAAQQAGETSRHNRAEEGIQAQTRALEEKKFEATYGTGKDENGNPVESPQARAIAEYRQPGYTGRAATTGIGQAIMGQVYKINPSYDAAQFPTRQKMRIMFTSGTQSQTLNSLNTAIEHLDQFKDAAEALNNGSFKPGNRAYNWLSEQFGSTAPTNFDGIKTIMSGELASAFKKSGATDQEIAHVLSSLDRANSPAQLTDYVTKIAIPALGSKAATYDAQWKQTMGEKDPFSVYTPGAKRVLDKYGASHAGSGSAPTTAAAPTPGMIRARDPQGNLHEAKAGTPLPAGWTLEK